jgi:hypothetical protein
MKPHGAHDYLPRPKLQPAEDFPGFKRILAMLILASVISAGICVTLIVRDAGHPHSPKRNPSAIDLRCRCGACARRSAVAITNLGLTERPSGSGGTSP